MVEKLSSKHVTEGGKKLTVYKNKDGSYRIRKDGQLVAVSPSRVKAGSPSRKGGSSKGRGRKPMSQKEGYERSESGRWIKVCPEGKVRGPSGRCKDANPNLTRSLARAEKAYSSCQKKGKDFNPYSKRCLNVCPEGEKRFSDYKCYSKCPDGANGKRYRSPITKRCMDVKRYKKHVEKFAHDEAVVKVAERLGIKLKMPKALGSSGSKSPKRSSK